MKHKIGYNRLGRKSAHRKAMTRNMLVSFFRHERIKTTKAKALAIRRTAEKMITRAKIDSVHNRRMIGRDIKDKGVLARLFTEIGPRYKERPGGYTRVLKLGPRPSDAAEMVILELVDRDGTESVAEEKATKKKRAPRAKKEDAPAENEPKATEATKKATAEGEDAAEAKDAPAEETSAEVAEEASVEVAAEAAAEVEAGDAPEGSQDE